MCSTSSCQSSIVSLRTEPLDTTRQIRKERHFTNRPSPRYFSTFSHRSTDAPDRGRRGVLAKSSSRMSTQADTLDRSDFRRTHLSTYSRRASQAHILLWYSDSRLASDRRDLSRRNRVLFVDGLEAGRARRNGKRERCHDERRRQSRRRKIHLRGEFHFLYPREWATFLLTRSFPARVALRHCFSRRVLRIFCETRL